MTRCTPTKPILDKIDRVLAQHYGFTEEELDFIINYDIKYRIGMIPKNEKGQECRRRARNERRARCPPLYGVRPSILG